MESSATVDEPSPPQYPIESVDNALKIILLLGERESIRLTDVSRYLEVASSTAHRLLQMLQYRGFVRQNPGTKAYEPGPALSQVAFAVMRQVDVRARVRPVLQRLSGTVGETAHLGRLDGTEISFIDSIESSRAVRVGSRLGMSMPAHCTSTGKAVLATLSNDELRQLYPRNRLPVLTDKSIGTRSALEAELASVRERGYASSTEESEESVASVAVSLGTFAGARYAINVSSPTVRMSDDVRVEVAKEVRRSAEELGSYFL